MFRLSTCWCPLQFAGTTYRITTNSSNSTTFWIDSKDVYNGDIGYIDDVDPDAGELTASFDGRAVTDGFGELDTLVPAYAATIHKSQGSE